MRHSLKRLAWAMIPMLSGCQTGTALDDYLPAGPPTVSGFPAAPPRNVKSVVVWGNDDRVAAAAASWLKEQGLTVYGRGRVQQVLDQSTAAETTPLINEAAVLNAVSEVGADAAVFADRVGDVRPPMVSVKGVDVRNGRLLWSGEARYETFYGLPNTEAMTVLTDAALMSAWGLQPKED
ncbi:MAG: hypothetical protein MUF20_12910 [Methylotetracoccus sp.]|nr:hypothetical protein [Methylotetracoccus sp.]